MHGRRRLLCALLHPNRRASLRRAHLLPLFTVCCYMHAFLHIVFTPGCGRLGVYTSSTRGTVQRALTKLAGNLYNALQHAPQRPGFPAQLPQQLFHVIMCRDHCRPADKVRRVVGLCSE